MHAKDEFPGRRNPLPQPGSSKPRRNLGWAALAIGLAATSVFLWMGNRNFDEQLRALKQNSAEIQRETAHNRALLELFKASDTISVPLAPASGFAAGPGKVEYNAARRLLFYSGTLPAPPENKCYQLWLVPAAGNPVSARVFQMSNAGSTFIELPSMPAGLQAKEFMVTIEPAGGRPQPTGPKIQIGEVR